MMLNKFVIYTNGKILCIANYPQCDTVDEIHIQMYTFNNMPMPILHIGNKNTYKKQQQWLNSTHLKCPESDKKLILLFLWFASDSQNN